MVRCSKHHSKKKEELVDSSFISSIREEQRFTSCWQTFNSLIFSFQGKVASIIDKGNRKVIGLHCLYPAQILGAVTNFPIWIPSGKRGSWNSFGRSHWHIFFTFCPVFKTQIILFAYLDLVLLGSPKLVKIVLWLYISILSDELAFLHYQHSGYPLSFIDRKF
jgi:hypothetical protein